MNIKASTGLRNGLLGTGSLHALLNGLVVMRIYAGTEPATADAALGGATLLSEISDNDTGDGLDFDPTPAGGVLSKAPAQTWLGNNAASGVATFYRLEELADDGTLSTTRRRIQGTVGVAGASLNLSSTSLVSAAPQRVDFFSVSLPTF